MTSVLWFQGGACSGNTMSFINAAEPSVVDLIVDYGLEIVYHPTLSMEIGQTAQDLFWSYARGEKEIDIFVYEGSVIEAPNGTGRFDMFAGRPMKDWVDDIAPKAGLVVAIGDCATWGGLPAVPPNPSQSRGLQFDRGGKRGGYLGPDFVSKLGLPVINIPGCPAHPDWISQILVAGRCSSSSDSAQRRSSRRSRSPAAPACSSSPTSRTRRASARACARAACSTSSAAAAR